MAKCIANLGDYFLWLASTPPSFYCNNVTYGIDTGNSWGSLQVPILFTDPISTIIQKVHDAIKADALSRFNVTLADTDIRIVTYSTVDYKHWTEGL